jgi:hypothetical protein
LKPINPQNPIVEEVFDDENTYFEDKDQDFLQNEMEENVKISSGELSPQIRTCH